MNLANNLFASCYDTASTPRITCTICWRRPFSSLDKMLGWFPHTSTEWFELIIVALLLRLLMVVAMSEIELLT